MKHQTDPDYLQNQAYNDAFDLNVRTHILTHYRGQAQSWYPWLFSQLVLPENGRILEIGCGPGDLWQQNEERLLPNWHICLADLSSGMVETAQHCLHSSPASFSFVVLDSAALPFAENTFAAVMAFGLMDHLPDPTLALSEVRRVLQPEGNFYASAGGQTHLQQIENLIKPFLPEVHYGGDPGQFGLQNGLDFLAPFFREVEQRPYQNILVFHDPDPIAAYVLSEPEVRQQLRISQWDAFQYHLKQELLRQGEIRVAVEKGVFIGKK